MQSKINFIKLYSFQTVISLGIILSYFFGLFLNENSSGGALPDFKIHLQTTTYLKEGLDSFFSNYKNFGNTHSPIYIIFLDFINLDNNLLQTRFIYSIICILLPFYFYKCLTLKFLNIDKKILIYLSLFFLYHHILDL